MIWVLFGVYYVISFIWAFRKATALFAYDYLEDMDLPDWVMVIVIDTLIASAFGPFWLPVYIPFNVIRRRNIIIPRWVYMSQTRDQRLADKQKNLKAREERIQQLERELGIS